MNPGEQSDAEVGFWGLVVFDWVAEVLCQE
jgi:hypothetical protein